MAGTLRSTSVSNLEHYAFGEHSVGLLDAVAQRNPDPINFNWPDYGVRIGVWRMAELFERLELKPSVLLNADVCDEYPRISKRETSAVGLAIAHGKNNSMFAGDPPHLSKGGED